MSEIDIDAKIDVVFALFDKDKEGDVVPTLSPDELTMALQYLKIDLTPDEIAAFQQDDKEGFTREEFKELVQQHGDFDCKTRVQDCFNQFDESNTGTLSRDQLMDILCHKGDASLTEEEAELILDEADTNGDGIFDIEELTKLLYRDMEPAEEQPEQE